MFYIVSVNIIGNKFLIFKKQTVMPQIDKVTFAIIAYWVFIFYVLQFLSLNVTHLYRFFNSFKAKAYRLLLIKLNVQLYIRYIVLISSVTWLMFLFSTEMLRFNMNDPLEQFEIVRFTWQSLACSHVITNFSIVLSLNAFFISFFLSFFSKENSYNIWTFIFKNNIASHRYPYMFILLYSLLFFDLVNLQGGMKPWNNSGFLFFIITIISYLYNNFFIEKVNAGNTHAFLPIQEQFQKWSFSVANTTSSNKAPEQEPVKDSVSEKKRPSSWKQFFFLRLIIIFGLLFFLGCSYLLNESFNITKVYNQVIIFFNDENMWHNSYVIIRKCWLTYISIWAFRQWAISIATLLLLYWYLFDVLYYIGLIENKFTSRQKVFFIGTDLFLNFIVGLAYMAHPRTVIGELMHMCPVALSPYFIVAEIMGYLLYQAWLKYRAKK
jgi:hypothetical protein